jgi:hypothetical protein
MYLHLYCTYIQGGKHTEKMVQGYQFRPDTPVIIRPIQLMTQIKNGVHFAV